MGTDCTPTTIFPNTLLDDWSVHTFPSLAVPVFCVCMKSFLLSFKVGSWALFRPVELRISLTNINYTLPSLQELKVFQKFKNHRSKVLKKNCHRKATWKSGAVGLPVTTNALKRRHLGRSDGKITLLHWFSYTSFTGSLKWQHTEEYLYAQKSGCFFVLLTNPRFHSELHFYLGREHFQGYFSDYFLLQLHAFIV